MNDQKMDDETKKLFWQNVRYFGGKLLEAVTWICLGIGALQLLNSVLDKMF